MTNRFRLLLVLLAVVGCCFVGTSAAFAEEEKKAEEKEAEPEKKPEPIFPDKNLEAVVRQYVFEKRNTEEPITAEDVENISTIEGKNKYVKDLTGLEKCYSLALLDLEGNEIHDLSPIKELTNLQSVNLANNKIANKNPGIALPTTTAADVHKSKREPSLIALTTPRGIEMR